MKKTGLYAIFCQTFGLFVFFRVCLLDDSNQLVSNVHKTSVCVHKYRFEIEPSMWMGSE